MEITVKQAFNAMFYLLDNYYDEKKVDDLGAMLGSMNPHLFDGDMPADVATWHEWITIVKKVVSYEVEGECLDDSRAFQAMLDFLNYYHREFGLSIEEVIEDLASNKLGSRDFQKMWRESIEQAIAD